MKEKLISLVSFCFILSGLSGQCLENISDFSFCYGPDRTDFVELEICQSGIIDVTICQGVYGISADNLTVYEGPAGSGTTGSIVLEPTSGNL